MLRQIRLAAEPGRAARRRPAELPAIGDQPPKQRPTPSLHRTGISCALLCALFGLAAVLLPGCSTVTSLVSELTGVDLTELLGDTGLIDDQQDDATKARVTLPEVRFWACQLENVEAEWSALAMIASRYDMLVIEPVRNQQGLESFNTARLVDRLQASGSSDPDRGKLVLAYLPIGYAETTRTYWEEDWLTTKDGEDSAPGFLLTDGTLRGTDDYPVAYWDPQWQDIMIFSPESMLQQILDDGFDGIYLAGVGAFEADIVRTAAASENHESADEMLRFIELLREYALSQNPEFVILAQNGLWLEEEHKEYLEAVDGIVQEGVYFTRSSLTLVAGDSEDADTDGESKQETTAATDVPTPEEGPPPSRDYYETLLFNYMDTGMPAFVLDYAQEPDNVSTAYTRAAANGFVPYVTISTLDRLSDTPPPELPR
jgi:cysteinyl-tRNA synthetase